jgi:hypothetical protein
MKDQFAKYRLLLLDVVVEKKKTDERWNHLFPLKGE